jgi:hypothetical protein
MGQRANLVIIENGEWQLFYDHWIANSLHYELLWGPSIAVEFVRGMHHEKPTDWLDEIWCEGAALIDLDRKHLLWFSLEMSTSWPEQQALMALLRYQWPGWTIEWAWQGLIDLVRYLGLPDHLVLDPKWQQEKERFIVDAEYDENNCILASYKQHGEYRVGWISSWEGITTELAGDDLRESLALLQATELVWPEAIDGPISGIHLDCDTQTLYYWQLEDFPLAHERLAALWPNWRTVYLFDTPIEQHLALLPLDIRLNRPDPLALQRKLIEGLGRHYARGISNPIGRIAERLEQEGRNVQINPYAFYSATPVRNDDKAAILHHLQSRLPIT